MTDPHTLGRYRLEDSIGAGSFATVYRARDGWLDQPVALKVLAENHSLNPEIRERFIAEGRNLRKLENPHVITVYDIGESSRQQPYLVLSLADRGTLADRVASLRSDGWTATAADVLAVTRDLAAALTTIHAARLVHRDLSPGNLLLTSVPEPREATDAQSTVLRSDEKVVVADLGMCKDLALNSGLTVAGGTAGFRPPEQQGGAGVVDTRADLWSLSAVIAWLTEGSAVRAKLDPVLRRSLATDPEARHPDVASWLRDVESALAPDPPLRRDRARSARGSRGAPNTASDAQRAWWQARWVVPVAAVAAAVILFGAGLLFGGTLGTGSAAQSGSASVAIDGPDRTAVGEEATFTAEVTGLEHWVWTLPSGRYLADRETVSVTAESAGAAELVLQGRDENGRLLEVVHPFSVSDNADNADDADDADE